MMYWKKEFALNTLQIIQDAIKEAKILESIRDVYDQDRMLFVAMKLSGAPWSFILEVFQKEEIYG